MSSWLFLIGLLIAVIFGFIVGANLWTDTNNYGAILLVILGFVVGIMTFLALGNISKEKIPTFLLAALILISIAIGASTDWIYGLNYIGPYISSIATMLAVFVAPAAGLLALRAIWDASKTEELIK
ncbi:MAG: hypothetical protein MUO82_08350 [Candidatus Thermoplasmatota archaeon]|nr:hypothetical protein [Candidatus Thermoplasmatota archaeon]